MPRAIFICLPMANWPGNRTKPHFTRCKFLTDWHFWSLYIHDIIISFPFSNLQRKRFHLLAIAVWRVELSSVSITLLPAAQALRVFVVVNFTMWNMPSPGCGLGLLGSVEGLPAIPQPTLVYHARYARQRETNLEWWSHLWSAIWRFAPLLLGYSLLD